MAGKIVLHVFMYSGRKCCEEHNCEIRFPKKEFFDIIQDILYILGNHCNGKNIMQFIQCEIKHILSIIPLHIMNRKNQIKYVLPVIACFTRKSALSLNLCAFEKMAGEMFLQIFMYFGSKC